MSTPSKFVAVALFSSIMSALVTYWWHGKRLEQQLNESKSRRQEERTGRIRAEVKLRTTLKELERLRVRTSDETTRDCMVMHAIGTVVSPYTKRMGTPRQPQLVPSSRGYIEFCVPAASLSGIDEYSHIWVLFEFHANTDLTANNNNKRTKIRPPRGGGVKVGQLATRSPHRPNAIGLSLIKIERWDETKRRLHLLGLDLVHGTPVYDIKPCVPWDIPGYDSPRQGQDCLDLIKVPSWVSQKDEIALVSFSKEATAQLQSMVTAGRLAPLYTDQNNGHNAAMQTLQEILAQDPRSSHKGLKENARGTLQEGNNTNLDAKGYRLIFCQCEIEFVVLPAGAQVTKISAIDFDPDSYVDGVPLISKSKAADVISH